MIYVDNAKYFTNEFLGEPLLFLHLTTWGTLSFYLTPKKNDWWK